MSIRAMCGVTGAVLLSAMAVFAQDRDVEQEETPITVVGCVVKESDYRRQMDAGKGGFAGTGAGRGNEYVLVNASRADASGGATGSTDCSSISGQAYELTGSREPELEAYVGRRVEISGMLKEADVEAVGTSGSTRTEGGVDPLGQDLRLLEIELSSFREASAAAPVQAQAGGGAASSTQVEREPEAAPAPSPVGTTGAQQGGAGQAETRDAPADQPDDLPRTASPLALIGLLGLLSFGGAFGIRMMRR